MQDLATTVSRRAHLRWLCSAPAALAVAGCGRSPSAPADTARPGLEPAKLMWQFQETTPEYAQFAQEAIGRFRQQYPQITFETMVDGNGNNVKTLPVLIAGEGPDIIKSYPPSIWELAAKGQVLNHNELVKDLKKADVEDFHKYQWEGMVIPSTNFRYGLPTVVDMDLLFYNRQLFRQRGVKEPTADWGRDEYAAALKQLTFMDGAQQVWGGYKPMTSFARFQNVVTMFGGHVVDPKDLTKTQLHLPEAQRGLEWARARLFNDQAWAPLTMSYGQAADSAFPQGTLAMIEVGTGRLARIAQAMQQTEWDIQHIPKGPTKRAAFGDTDCWSIWKRTKARDAAWLWMKFITSPEFYAKQVPVNLKLVPRKSVVEVWFRAVRNLSPSAANVNMKVITDALGTMNYHAPNENFLCQAEAGAVIQPALNQIFRDGTATPTLFRDTRTQIEAAAGGCGFFFK